MQGVFPSPRGGAVQTLGLSFMASALGSSNLMLSVALKVTRIELLSITGRDRIT
jgi:hypothetical protein